MTVAAPPRSDDAVRPHWRYGLRRLAWAAVDLVFTPTCAGCGRLGERFCGRCQTEVALLRAPVCRACGYPVSRAGACAHCRGPGPGIAPLAGLRSAAFFEGPLRLAIHQFKYRRDVGLADGLARYLVAPWAALGRPGAAVLPVPLAAQRQRERGYNQSGLLARAFADLTRLPYLAGAVERVRPTASQVGLSAAERRANVAGAFCARAERVAGRSLVLVDDVCTTGATLTACAEALCAAGAAAVWALTLGRARGGPGSV
jgi:ComF family protein